MKYCITHHLLEWCHCILWIWKGSYKAMFSEAICVWCCRCMEYRGRFNGWPSPYIGTQQICPHPRNKVLLFLNVDWTAVYECFDLSPILVNMQLMYWPIQVPTLPLWSWSMDQDQKNKVPDLVAEVKFIVWIHAGRVQRRSAVPPRRN